MFITVFIFEQYNHYQKKTSPILGSVKHLYPQICYFYFIFFVLLYAKFR